MADRPTASTITDDQLEALYAELDRYVLREIDRTDGEQDQRLAGHGVLHGLAGVARRRTEQRDRARRVAVALENENARLEQQLADTCADGARAEQQLAAVRALHTSSQETRGVGRGSPWRPYCDHCHQDWPCATIRALDGAQQPETDVQCRTVDVDGTPVHVRGAGDWTDEDAHHFADIVRAAKRRFEAEPGPADEGDR